MQRSQSTAPSLRSLRQFAGSVLLLVLGATHASLRSIAATPEVMDEKLDRIFVLTAIDQTGAPVIITPANKSSAPKIYAAVSTTGLDEVREAIRESTDPSAEGKLRFTPTTLNYFLQRWKSYRAQLPSLAASINPDSTERDAAIRLLQQQGLSSTAAAEEIGSDVPVFCPIPAIYAEDKGTTVHRRSSGKKFIPCSFSASTLMAILKERPDQPSITVVPVPLWKMINALKKESDAAVSSIEVLAHPTLLTGIEAAKHNKHFVQGVLAGSQAP